MNIFSYHSGLQALVMPGTRGEPIAIPVKSLREAGWRVSDEEMRRVLPRADVSSILASASESDIRAAAAARAAVGAVDRAVRGR